MLKFVLAMLNLYWQCSFMCKQYELLELAMRTMVFAKFRAGSTKKSTAMIHKLC